MKNMTQKYKKTIIISGVALLLLVIISSIIIIVSNNGSRIVYKPVKACDVFTEAEAKQLLGATIYKPNDGAPEITGSIAYSSCGYSDVNPDQNNMKVAAVSIRYGINDVGVARNKKEFITGKPTTNVQDVTNVGDAAYFNKSLGQLDVLLDGGKRWMVISYGIGNSPASNTVEDALSLARLVIR